MDVDEYEIIPTSPIRKIERRIEQMESTSSASEVRRLIDQIIELVKSNQVIINEVIKADNELRTELSKIPSKIDSLLSGMNEFMELLKATSAEETASDVGHEMMDPLVKKMRELVEHNKKM